MALRTISRARRPSAGMANPGGVKAGPEKKTAKPLGTCPRCDQTVVGFAIDAPTRDDITITLKPCGCFSHSEDEVYRSFAKIALSAWGVRYA